MSDMLSSMGLGGGAGRGAGGGMPDLAGLMNNPMMMQMAQQMMQNGGLDSLMQNPAVANMVCRHHLQFRVLVLILYIDEPRTIRRHAFNG